MTLPFEGRSALVTGGGTGIGKAAAIALARGGARVAITYFSHPDWAAETLAQLKGEGCEAYSLLLDATQVDKVNQVVPEAARLLGGSIDILVNNAGSLVARTPFTAMTPDYWRQVMAVNLDSAFYVTQAALPFIPGGRGRIIMLSSLAAHTGGGNGATAYSAAKAGLIGLTRGLAKELGPQGITVNAIAPGLILQTAFHETFSTPEGIQATINSIPLHKPGKPEDVAHAVVYLASEMADFITGETIEINGGAWFV
jgi:3-oxoacyl-[acyl-carrier protein] reductase